MAAAGASVTHKALPLLRNQADFTTSGEDYLRTRGETGGKMLARKA
jgi:hypothetical protein